MVQLVVLLPHILRVLGMIVNSGYCLCRDSMHVLSVSGVSLRFSHLLVGSICMHVALRWTVVPSKVYSCLMPSFPGIGLGSSMILTNSGE